MEEEENEYQYLNLKNYKRLKLMIEGAKKSGLLLNEDLELVNNITLRLDNQVDNLSYPEDKDKNEISFMVNRGLLWICKKIYGVLTYTSVGYRAIEFIFHLLSWDLCAYHINHFTELIDILTSHYFLQREILLLMSSRETYLSSFGSSHQTIKLIIYRDKNYSKYICSHIKNICEYIMESTIEILHSSNSKNIFVDERIRRELRAIVPSEFKDLSTIHNFVKRLGMMYQLLMSNYLLSIMIALSDVLKNTTTFNKIICHSVAGLVRKLRQDHEKISFQFQRYKYKIYESPKQEVLPNVNRKDTSLVRYLDQYMLDLKFSHEICLAMSTRLKAECVVDLNQIKESVDLLVKQSKKTSLLIENLQKLTQGKTHLEKEVKMEVNIPTPKQNVGTSTKLIRYDDPVLAIWKRDEEYEAYVQNDVMEEIATSNSCDTENAITRCQLSLLLTELNSKLEEIRNRKAAEISKIYPITEPCSSNTESSESRKSSSINLYNSQRIPLNTKSPESQISPTNNDSSESDVCTESEPEDVLKVQKIDCILPLSSLSDTVLYKGKNTPNFKIEQKSQQDSSSKAGDSEMVKTKENKASENFRTENIKKDEFKEPDFEKFLLLQELTRELITIKKPVETFTSNSEESDEL